MHSSVLLLSLASICLCSSFAAKSSEFTLSSRHQHFAHYTRPPDSPGQLTEANLIKRGNCIGTSCYIRGQKKSKEEQSLRTGPRSTHQSLNRQDSVPTTKKETIKAQRQVKSSPADPGDHQVGQLALNTVSNHEAAAIARAAGPLAKAETYRQRVAANLPAHDASDLALWASPEMRARRERFKTDQMIHDTYRYQAEPAVQEAKAWKKTRLAMNIAGIQENDQASG